MSLPCHSSSECWLVIFVLVSLFLSYTARNKSCQVLSIHSKCTSWTYFQREIQSVAWWWFDSTAGWSLHSQSDCSSRNASRVNQSRRPRTFGWDHSICSISFWEWAKSTEPKGRKKPIDIGVLSFFLFSRVQYRTTIQSLKLYINFIIKNKVKGWKEKE